MGRLNPSETIIRIPDDIVWEAPPDAPAQSVERAVLAGNETDDGQYLVLMKWYPGYMSTPHLYRTDRLCVVISGIWWCNSGSDFDPQAGRPGARWVLRPAGCGSAALRRCARRRLRAGCHRRDWNRAGRSDLDRSVATLVAPPLTRHIEIYISIRTSTPFNQLPAALVTTLLLPPAQVAPGRLRWRNAPGCSGSRLGPAWPGSR